MQPTPSQQTLLEAILARFRGIQGPQRPFLLTGDIGVGKSFLAAQLASSGGVAYHVARDFLSQLLINQSLRDMTPEAAVRFVTEMVERSQTPYAVADGFEPLLSLWAVERPRALPNFLLAFGRVIVNQPLLIVVQTSRHFPSKVIEVEDWWPCERRFRLELTQADKETAAVNWGLDPMRAHLSANLYSLLAVKLGR